MNIKPLFFHCGIIVLGTAIIAGYWNTSKTNDAVFVTFMLMLFLHYSAGFLLSNYQAWYKNLLSVLFVFLFNLILWFIRNQLFPSKDIDESLINMIIFVFKLPFLYILGWNGMNYPIVVALLPAVLLYLGLVSKILLNKMKSVFV